MPRFHLPGNAEHVIVQNDPALRVTFIVPAHKRKVTRYVTLANNNRQMQTVDMDVPQLLYIFDPEQANEHKLRIFVIDRIDSVGIFLRPFRLANVHNDDRICWGGNRPKGDPRDMVAEFWGSNFNDDLTQYPRSNDQDWFDSPEYKEYQAQTDNHAKIAEDLELAIQAYSRDHNYIADMISEKENDRQQVIYRFEDAVDGAKKGWMEIQKKIDYAIERGVPHDSLRVRFMQLQQRQVKAAELWGAYNRRYESSRVAVNRLHEIADYVGRYLFERVKGIATLPQFLGYMKRVLRTLDNPAFLQAKAIYLPAATRKELIAYVLHNGLESAAMRLTQGEDEFRSRFNARWNRESREQWWNGGFVKFGTPQNYRDYICGTDFQYYESGCCIVFKVNESNRDFAALFRNADGTPHHIKPGTMIPAFRAPSRNDLLLMVHDGRPFTVTKEGDRWVARHYDEGARATQEALTEIFG